MDLVKVELQDRDISLMLHIYNARILSGTEITVLFFNTVPFAYKRLRKLVKAGYITSASYSLESSRYGGKYYCLTQKGLRELISRGRVNNTKVYASQIIPSSEDIAYILKLGVARTALITSNIITINEWQHPHDIRVKLALPQFTPVSCQIRDILILRAYDVASRYSGNTLELADRLMEPSSRKSTGISSVIILYETEQEHDRLLSKYSSGAIHISTFADLPTLVTDIFAGTAKQHMEILMSLFRKLYPKALFDPPFSGSVTVLPAGTSAGQKTLLVDGITGGLPALQQFWGWADGFRVMLIRDGTEFRLVRPTGRQ